MATRGDFHMATDNPPHQFGFVVASPGEEGTAWQYRFEADTDGTRITESFTWRWTPLPDEGFRGRVGRMSLPEAEEQVAERQAHLQHSVELTLERLKASLESAR